MNATHTSTDTDVQVMLRTQDGDNSAFEALFQRHRHRVQNRLFQMTGDSHLADDLTQEAFLRVYRSRHLYRPMARFRTWLNQIVTNVQNAIRPSFSNSAIPLRSWKPPPNSRPGWSINGRDYLDLNRLA